MSARPKRHRTRPERTASSETERPCGGQKTAAAPVAIDDALFALARLLARQTARSAAGADTVIIHKDEPL
jgi:hypothetical protein